MTKELEIAAAAAVGGLVAPKGGETPTHCRNCGAALAGPYCHACGQRADDHHRSILHLTLEVIEGMTHLDGRIATTLPALLFRPGRLAADYVGGRLNRHIPPFRLFLVSLLIFMLSLEFVVNQGMGPVAEKLSASHASAKVNLYLDPARTAEARAAANNSVAGVPADVAAEIGSDKDVRSALKGGRKDTPQTRWLREHLTRAVGNPQFYLTVVFEWAHRLAVLLLPIFAALLSLLYVYRRKFFVYDHLMVAMQYLSFCFLLWAVIWLLPDPVQGTAMFAGIIWTPTNLFFTLRGAYGSSFIGALVKAIFLWLSTLFAFLMLIVGLLALALGQV
ncbi:MAG TPA: DUF3667 domain-containing protein [Caulobacteraceae bacterium]|jgi:hypothetical protein|nr:DUF3667 domain-containing protein [Caulobacteraceae bacterium]